MAWVALKLTVQARRFAAICGGRLLKPSAQDRLGTDWPDDPDEARALSRSTAVVFPPSMIPGILAALKDARS